jgi:hypothetical protein
MDRWEMIIGPFSLVVSPQGLLVLNLEGHGTRNDLGGGATELELRRILVKTGKYHPGDEDHVRGVQVAENFAAAVDSILASNKLDERKLIEFT